MSIPPGALTLGQLPYLMIDCPEETVQQLQGGQLPLVLPLALCLPECVQGLRRKVNIETLLRTAQGLSACLSQQWPRRRKCLWGLVSLSNPLWNLKFQAIWFPETWG